jgi:hypothetical protein
MVPAPPGWEEQRGSAAREPGRRRGCVPGAYPAQARAAFRRLSRADHALHGRRAEAAFRRLSRADHALHGRRAELQPVGREADLRVVHGCNALDQIDRTTGHRGHSGQFDHGIDGGALLRVAPLCGASINRFACASTPAAVARSPFLAAMRRASSGIVPQSRNDRRARHFVARGAPQGWLIGGGSSQLDPVQEFRRLKHGFDHRRDARCERRRAARFFSSARSSSTSAGGRARWKARDAMLSMTVRAHASSAVVAARTGGQLRQAGRGGGCAGGDTPTRRPRK